MNTANFLTIGLGAALGAWMRWLLGILLNPLFPTLPFGTLAANVIGGFLMGILMEFTKQFPILPETIRLAIATGFLGGLTTFSTFSAEATTLLSHHTYGWGLIHIASHLIGSICATFGGIYCVKLLTLG